MLSPGWGALGPSRACRVAEAQLEPTTTSGPDSAEATKQILTTASSVFLGMAPNSPAHEDGTSGRWLSSLVA